MLILSGCDHVRFPTMLNQRAYAREHNYRYRFDLGPYPDRHNTYFHKLDAIDDALVDTDWLFWIDDDAAFTQLEMRLEDIVPELNDPTVAAIFCASPVNPQGGWTAISSGNFFIRNNQFGRRLIKNAKATDLSVVARWWDTEELGMFTSGDQDALMYQIKTDRRLKGRIKVLEYERFNTRPYHYDWGSQHFLVHFTNLPDTTKEAQMAHFVQRFGLSPFFLPEQVEAKYASYRAAQIRMIGRDLFG